MRSARSRSVFANIVITIPTRPCPCCGRVLKVSPRAFLARAPAIPCENCGKVTQLSVAVNLTATCLGFVLAAVGVGAYLKAAQPADGAPMGILPFGFMFLLGIGIIMTTQVVVSTACYLIGDYLRGGDQRP